MCRFICMVALCLVSMEPPMARAEVPAVSCAEAAGRVNVHDFIELTLNVAHPTAANPFTDVAVSATFTREGGPYRAAWHNPRTGKTTAIGRAQGPSWTSPEARDNGGRALLLRKP